VHGTYGQKSDRITFIEEARAQGFSTPGHQFTNYKEERVKLRSTAARIYKELKKIDPRFAKLVKVDGPAPGSYQVDTAFSKTQTCNTSQSIPKNVKPSFIDITLHEKKHVPGIGQYEGNEKKLVKHAQLLTRKRI
jgi:hypothetical protein